MTTCLDPPCEFQVLMADSIGFISGTGAIIHPNIIISSAQHFEGYVFCLFSGKTIWRATHICMIFQR